MKYFVFFSGIRQVQFMTETPESRKMEKSVKGLASYDSEL